MDVTDSMFAYDRLQDVGVSTNVSSNSSSSTDYYDDYDYDYDDSVSSVILWELVPVCVAYCLTFLLGVTGNVLVIVSIVRSRAMHTVTNVFLVSLASADLMLVLFCVPIKVMYNSSSFSQIFSRFVEECRRAFY